MRVLCFILGVVLIGCRTDDAKVPAESSTPPTVEDFTKEGPSDPTLSPAPKQNDPGAKTTDPEEKSTTPASKKDSPPSGPANQPNTKIRTTTDDHVCQIGSTCPSSPSEASLEDVIGALVIHRVMIHGAENGEWKTSAGNGAVAFLSERLPDDPWETILPGANLVYDTPKTKVILDASDTLSLHVGDIVEEFPNHCPFLTLYSDAWTKAQWKNLEPFSIRPGAAPLKIDPEKTLVSDWPTIGYSAIVPIAKEHDLSEGAAAVAKASTLERKVGDTLEINLARLQTEPNPPEPAQVKTFLVLRKKDDSGPKMYIELIEEIEAESKVVSIPLASAIVMEGPNRSKVALPPGEYRMDLQRIERSEIVTPSKKELFVESQVEFTGLGILKLTRK